MKKQFILFWAGCWLAGMPLAVAAPPPRPTAATTAILAQTDTPATALEFLAQLGRGDERGALQLAMQHPEEAAEIFMALIQKRGEMTTPDEVQQYKVCVTLLARGLQLAGHPEAMQLIQQRQEVDARTAALTLETARSVAADDPNRAQSSMELILPAKAAMYMVEVGNFVQLAPFLDALLADLVDIEGQKSVDPQVVEQLKLAALQARMISGEYTLARTDADALLKRVRALKDQEDLVSAYTLVIMAARLGAMPDLVAKYLPTFRQEMKSFKDPQRPLYQLALHTWETESALAQNPNMSPSELLKRHTQAWGPIAQFHVQKTGDSFVFNDNVRFWNHQLIQSALLAKTRKQDAVRKQLTEALVQEVNASERLAKEEVENDGLGMMLGFALNTIQLHAEMLDLGMVSEASGILKMLDSKQLDVIDQAMVDAQAMLWKQLPSHFLKRLPAGFQVDFREGWYALLRERFCRAQLLQLLAEHAKGLSAGEAENARALAAEGMKYNAMAVRGLGYQGLDDIRWTVLEYLLRDRPENWQEETARILEPLRKESQAAGHRPGTARALMMEGELLAEQGKIEAAVTALQNGVQSLESYVSDVGGGQLGAEAIRKNYKRGYDLLARLLIQAGRGAQALDTLARQQELENTQLNQEALAGSTQSVAKLQALRGQSAALQQQYAAKASLGLPTAGVEKLIAQNKSEFHQVLSELRRTNPEYEQRLAIRPVNFSKLQSSIPENTTVVQYFPSKDSLYIFVATSRDLKIRQISVGEAELDGLIRDTRQLIQEVPVDPQLREGKFSWADDGSPLYKRHTARLKNDLSTLYNDLIAPVVPDLGDRKVLAIIPTGNLHYVPYPALCKLGPDGLPQFLAQDYQCVNIVTVADLARVAQPPADRHQSVFAVGNPDGSLPGAEREVNKIAEFFPKAQRVIGPKATADQLRKIPPKTTYVHLATHGHLDSKIPTHSYLVMAGNGDKGRFEVGEIYGLPLDGVRLVTLSACETAVAGSQPGSEVTNLAEAFSVAGGNSVVASLWNVSDEGTEALMTEFYRNLSQQKALSESLQQAEVSVLKQPKLAHPFYWAAFTLFGDWR